MRWLQQQGLLSALAVESQWMAHCLSALGFDVLLAYIGSHPYWTSNAEQGRDIPVLKMECTSSRRPPSR